MDPLLGSKIGENGKRAEVKKKTDANGAGVQQQQQQRKKEEATKVAQKKDPVAEAQKDGKKKKQKEPRAQKAPAVPITLPAPRPKDAVINTGASVGAVPSSAPTMAGHGMGQQP